MPRNEFARLSAFYFFYYAVLGAFVPYRGRYFDSQGFDSITIGLCTSAISLATIAAPYGWAALADRYHAGQRVLLLGVLASLLALAFGLQQTVALPMILAMSAYSLFWNAIIPQAETLTLARTAKTGSDYSRIRLWGSVGYLITVLLVGYAIQAGGPATMQPVVLAFMAILLISALLLPRHEQINRDMLRHDRLRTQLRKPAVIAFLIATTLMTISHAPYYTFFDLYLRGLGYSASESGWLITLGVVAEIGMFLLTKRLFARFRLAPLLLFALIVSALRWYLLATFADNFAVLLFVQVLHAVSFALIHALAMQFLHSQFPLHQRSRAQAIYSALSYGVGGALGNLLAGFFWRNGAGGSDTYLMASAACVLAAVVMAVSLRSANITTPTVPSAP
ncbi:MFS transporter [Permianibacter sp. IMCC34836]|uniref:MFS transporter n=1 Tax=Permianibacter fluminis TaxID=2738515 RepID=UPI00155374F2|nr:MFS transporter [Permianibacter fluminis]NQD38156.1 MFS transporter [Permianibacter fluminis]